MEIINEWDPIGFFPMAPNDEYINEIEEYLSVSECHSEEQLAQRINEIFISAFGKDVYDENIQECEDIACKILHTKDYY